MSQLIRVTKPSTKEDLGKVAPLYIVGENEDERYCFGKQFGRFFVVAVLK